MALLFHPNHHTGTKYQKLTRCLLPIIFLMGFSAASLVTAKPTYAAARFYVSPASGNYKVGDTITASIFIDSDGQAINSGEGTITYPQDMIDYQSVSTSGSIFTLWTNGPTGNATQTTFGGGVAHPGYTGSAGKVLTLSWKAKAKGTATITMNGSRILADDGQGTNVYGSSSNATYTIEEAKTTPSLTLRVTSASHPDQTKWYNRKGIDVSWNNAATLQSFLTAFDQSARTDPTVNVAKTTTKHYDADKDGVWYFHVKGRLSEGYTNTVHFKLQIDTQQPDPFVVTLIQEKGHTDPTPRLMFETKDSLSGIDHYDVSLDGGTPTVIESGSLLPKQKPGNHVIVIHAFDKAGNVRESQATYAITAISPVTIIRWPTIVALLDPIEFIGTGQPGDIIHVYLKGKEISSFKVDEQAIKLNGSDNTQIFWQWRYTERILPGIYSFQFSRTDSIGAESELTPFYSVTVSSRSIRLGTPLWPTQLVIGILILLVITLSVALTLLLGKLSYFLASARSRLGMTGGWFKRSFHHAEEEIVHDIDTGIPGSDLKAQEVETIKRHLKEDVHAVLQAEEQNLKRQSDE